MTKRMAVLSLLFAMLWAGVACGHGDSERDRREGSEMKVIDAEGTDLSQVDEANIKDALRRSNLNDVTAWVDHKRKFVRLSGTVRNEPAKHLAEEITRQHSGEYQVENQISIKNTDGH